MAVKIKKEMPILVAEGGFLLNAAGEFTIAES